jgi:hypothetical protein
LRPALLQSIRAYAAQHGLGPVGSHSRLCVPAHSEKKKKGLFGSRGGAGPDPFHESAPLLTSQWPVCARSGPRSGAVRAAARLRQARVSAFESRLIPHTGLEVPVPQPGSPEPVTAFVPLGPDISAAVTQQVPAAMEAAA